MTGSESDLSLLLPDPGGRRWWVALSGGLDSVVLLHRLVALRELNLTPELQVVHINHQLQDSANDWQQHCERLCAALDVPVTVHRVHVKPDSGRGLEAAARDARYRVFEDCVGEGEVLLLAHHLDDQVETFFLRMLRGAGTLGLSGMPRQRALGRGMLCRPLLQHTRAELEMYASAQGLGWVEDTSNQDLTFDRNYLRNAVLPMLEQRWPGYRKSVVGAATAAADAESLLEAQYSSQLEDVTSTRWGESCIDIHAVLAQPAAGACALLRFWLRRQGQTPCGRRSLQEFVEQLRHMESDSAPLLQAPGYCLQRYRDHVYLRSTPDQDADPVAWRGRIEPGETVVLPDGSALHMVAATGSEGLVVPADGGWSLRLREGGERCRPVGRGHSQTLKKLLQDYGMPPWQRAGVPLLFAGEEIAAVSDLWVCEGHLASSGERGWKLALGPSPH